MTSPRARAPFVVGVLALTACVSVTTEDEPVDHATSALGITVPWRVDFGTDDCRSPFWETMSIQNGAPQAVSFQVQTSFQSAFDVSPTWGTIPAGGQIGVRITPKPPLGIGATRPGDYRETLRVTTSAPGDYPHNVEIWRHVRGAWITVAPTDLSFTAQPGQSQTASVLFVNEGNESATVFLSVPPPFATSQSSFSLYGGAALSVPITFTGQAAGASTWESASINVFAACNDVPHQVALRGRTLF